MAKHHHCPIVGCFKTFHGSRGGWDAHVASSKSHRNWHPNVSGDERKRIFKKKLPKWFED